MAAEEYKTSILVVDDTPENIDILDGILKEDYKIYVALNGESAIKLAAKHKPDLILLDVMMPGMDGYEVCKVLKDDDVTKKIPIIFVTAKADVESELIGFKLGAVDYITKPISPPVVMARVQTHLKIQQLMLQLERDKEKVSNANKQMIHDQEMAKSIFDKMIQKGCLDLPNLKYVLKPMEIFAGDLLLANRGPDGSVYMLLGDFTGHGLVASVGVMPTSGIFYDMSKKGFSLTTIMMEINNTLNTSLPIGVFCAACAMHIDVKNNLLSVWNGWNPEGLLVDAKGNIIHTFKSNHMPLGLRKQEKFDATPEIAFMEKDSRLYIYSDGITEAKNIQGEMFGQEKVMEIFAQHKDPNTYFEEIMRRLTQHCEGTKQGDDITILEFHSIINKN